MSPAPNGVYNIGTGKATSFEDIASIQARPAGSTDCQVEMFVGLT